MRSFVHLTEVDGSVRAGSVRAGSVKADSVIRRFSQGQTKASVVGRGMTGERRGLLRPEVVCVTAEAAVDPHIVVLLLLHGAVVGGLGEAEVVVRHPLAAKVVVACSLVMWPVASCIRDRPCGAGLVELAARAVGSVEVRVDQIWSKALLK